MLAIKQITNRTTTTDSEIQLLKHYCCLGCREEVKVSRFRVQAGPEKGQVVTSEVGCYCEELNKIKKSQHKARVAKLHSTFERNSLINPDLLKATFENFEPGEFSSSLQKAKHYADTFDINNPSNLFFQGTFGTGKSHLSVAVTKVVTSKGYSTIFISTPKLLTKIRSTYNKSSEQTENQIIHAITSADLVVFDDIGSEGETTGWTLQKIFEIVDQRMGKHNIFTTNLSSKEFEQSKDLRRIFSRLMDNSTPIIMNGTDYRRKQFKKGL